MAADQNRMKSLEQRLDDIESIVTKLEKGEQPIDEAIDEYARGLELAASCRKTLDEMTKRIEQVRQKTDELTADEPAAGDGQEQDGIATGSIPF